MNKKLLIINGGSLDYGSCECHITANDAVEPLLPPEVKIISGGTTTPDENTTVDDATGFIRHLDSAEILTPANVGELFPPRRVANPDGSEEIEPLLPIGINI
jgi:hypothetical protein